MTQYRRANAYYLLGKNELALQDYNKSISFVRKYYINKHPVFKEIMCDTCGTFLGNEIYLGVLKEWRSFEQKIERGNNLLKDNRILNDQENFIKALPNWMEERGNAEGVVDEKSLERLYEMMDSVKKK